jgi:hypothetical protein
MEVIKDYTVPPRGRGAPPKYPWHQWFRHGVTVCIAQGEDFDIDTNVMRQQLYQKARAMNGKVSTEQKTDVRNRQVIWMTFYSNEPDDEQLWPDQ